MDESWKHYAKLKQPQKVYILCGSISTSSPEQANLLLNRLQV